MHVAVCDDNIADRKQMERLLARESDRRANTTGLLYIDSYGNPEALYAHPMLYDVFYLDLCHTEGIRVDEVVCSLRDKGVSVPIVLCVSDIDYRQMSLGDNIYYLDKPIKVSELSKSIGFAQALLSDAVKKIELRTEDGNTLYVMDNDILYITEKGRYLQVKLSDGRHPVVLDTIPNMMSQLAPFEVFYPTSPTTIINLKHVTKLATFSFSMTDGRKFLLAPLAKATIKNFRASHEEVE